MEMGRERDSGLLLWVDSLGNSDNFIIHEYT